jgi:hypothetical protein
MITETDTWQAFTQRAAETLSKFQDNEISMAEAFRFFEANSASLRAISPAVHSRQLLM